MPGDWSVIYDEALGLYRRGRYADALAALREAEEPGVPKLVYLKMRCYIKLEMVRDALGCCEVLDATFHDPRVAVLFQQFRDEGVSSDQEILRELALLCAYEQASRLFRQHEYGEALEVLDEVGTQTNAELVYARARCLSKLGRFDEALESCRELEENYGDPRAAELIRKIEKFRGVRKQMLPPLEIPPPDFESAAAQAPEDTFVESQPDQQEMDYWDAVQREAKQEALIASLQEQVKTLSGEIEQLHAGESEAANALNDARSECSRVEAALHDRENALAEAEQRATELAASVTEARERAEAAAVELNALRTKHEEAEQALETANEDRDRLRRMLEERDTAGSDASRREAEQESLIAALRAQIETTEIEAKRLRALEQEQARVLEEMRSECVQLRESAADIEAQTAERIARSEMQVASLEEQLRAAVADVEQSRVREDDLAAKAGGIRAERDKLKKEIEELQSASAELAQRLETLEAELKAKTAEADEARAEGQADAAELDQMRLMCERLQGEVAERDATASRAAHRELESAAKTAALQAEVELLAAHAEMWNKQQAETASELEALRSEYDALKKTLSERADAAEQSSQRESELEASIAALRTEMEAARASADLLRKQEAETASELAELRAERDRLKEERDGYVRAAEETLQSDSTNKTLVASLQKQLKAATESGSKSRGNAERIAAELDKIRSERDHLKQMLDEHADAVAQSSQREAKLQAYAAFLKDQFEAAKAEIEQGVVDAAQKDEELETARAEHERLKATLDEHSAAAEQAAEREAKLEALAHSLQQHVEALSAKTRDLETTKQAFAQRGEDEPAEEPALAQLEPEAPMQELAGETGAPIVQDAAVRVTPPPPVKTEEERRQERKVSQDKLRAEQLRFLFPMLRPGIKAREVINMHGQPTRIEEAEVARKAGHEPRAAGIFGRVFGDQGGRSEIWVYDSPPWGSVRLEVVDKIVLRIHWQI